MCNRFQLTGRRSQVNFELDVEDYRIPKRPWAPKPVPGRAADSSYAAQLSPARQQQQPDPHPAQPQQYQTPTPAPAPAPSRPTVGSLQTVRETSAATQHYKPRVAQQSATRSYNNGGDVLGSHAPMSVAPQYSMPAAHPPAVSTSYPPSSSAHATGGYGSQYAAQLYSADAGNPGMVTPALFQVMPTTRQPNLPSCRLPSCD